jgi:P-loop containing dynein motor region
LTARQNKKAFLKLSFTLFFLLSLLLTRRPLVVHSRSSINQIVLNINFSSRTTSLDVQRTIEAAVEKRTKKTFGPPVGKKLIAFVDDMNMPTVDSYGTQQPIALLKLLIERGGMYGRGKELNWKEFKDMCKCPWSHYDALKSISADLALINSHFIKRSRGANEK